VHESAEEELSDECLFAANREDASSNRRIFTEFAREERSRERSKRLSIPRVCRRAVHTVVLALKQKHSGLMLVA